MYHNAIVELTILSGALVLLLCIFSHKLATRFGVPALVLFIVIGMLVGSDGVIGYYFDDYKLSEQVCSIALAFIMFYGGFGTNWKVARPVAPQAFLLSSVSVIVTAFLTAFFCKFAIHMSWLEAFLTGSVIASTDAASVFSILRSRNLNLKNNLASLLELESGSNDPVAYTMTFIFLQLMAASQGGNSIVHPYVWAAQILVLQIIIGVAVGVVAAWFAVKIFKNINFEGSGLAIIFTVSVALVSYTLPVLIGGNGYLSTYIAGIILGNSKIKYKIGLVHFFDGISWIMQIVLFFVLGLLAFPSQIPNILAPALFITLFLTFAARPIAVTLILSFFKTPWRQQLLVAWAGLRGSSSIVFAVMAVVSNAYTKFDLFHIVFTASLLSVTFQGTLLPLVAKKLRLVDNSNSVSKTFNDYIDPDALRLVDISINEQHPWANKKIKDIQFQKKTLLVLIKRGDDFIVPRGDTVILNGDILTVNSNTHYEDTRIPLSDVYITKKHEWVGKKLKDIPFDPSTLIVMIKRQNESIVPDGNTVLYAGDDVVVSNLPHVIKS